MKIAVACIKDNVAEHFGHCENFAIYVIENNKIVSKEVVENPGHEKGFLPRFLKDLDINLVISGGMGQGAIDIFNEENIEIITGNLGKNDEIVNNYLDGKLKTNGAICNRHVYKDECENH